MKHKRFFRVLAVALTLALLLVAIPATPAMAAYEVNVENDNTESDYYGEATGTIGDALHIWGIATATSIDIYFSSQDEGIGTGNDIDTEVTAYEILIEDVPVTVFDTFNVTMGISVPAELTDGTDDEPVHGGTYYIYITTAGSLDIRASTTFTVASVAVVEMDEDSGTVGTEVEITGEGFAPDENIIIEYDGIVLEEDEIVEGDPEADGDGEFSVIIAIPESTYGEHTITIIGEDSDAELELTFTVESEIILDPVEGEAGTEVTVTGTGFDRRNGVDFSFGGESIEVEWVLSTTGRTINSGSFIVNLIVPAEDVGTYTILAMDEDDEDIYAEAVFDIVVNSVININPTSGNVGDEIDVTGSGFGAGATATIYFDDEDVGTVPVGSDGSFTADFEIPASTAGVHEVKVEADSRSDTASISVEPDVTMTPTSGIRGDTISIEGTGFGGDKDIAIMYGTTAVTPATPITTGDSGSFSGSFDVPAMPGGSYAVEISDGTNDLSVNFTIEAGATISPTSGEMGDTVQITGHGFRANKTITILYGSDMIAPTAPITTDPTTGSFSGSFDVPAMPGGTATLTITDGTTSISVSFTVEANIDLNPISGEVGAGVAIVGYGFRANRSITILFNNTTVTPVAPVMTNDSGIFSAAQFYVPTSPGGAATLTISDGTTTINRSFTVKASDVEISPKTSNASPGHIGTEITISGDGYTASAPIEVTYDGAVLVTDPDATESNGSFTATFEIPSSVAGEHTIAVSINGIEAGQFTFIMESTAPPIPDLAAIFYSAKAEPPIKFDWREVEDESLPVTYNLEVYKVEGGIEVTVIEKTGLSVTEYTLTEAEVLELIPLEKNEYYYWRVNAEDNAGNTSAWSAVDTFKIGGGGGWPGWLMWLWIGLGGLAVFIFALWLGRRIAYSTY